MRMRSSSRTRKTKRQSCFSQRRLSVDLSGENQYGASSDHIWSPRSDSQITMHTFMLCACPSSSSCFLACPLVGPELCGLSGMCKRKTIWTFYCWPESLYCTSKDKGRLQKNTPPSAKLEFIKKFDSVHLAWTELKVSYQTIKVQPEKWYYSMMAHINDHCI